MFTFFVLSKYAVLFELKLVRVVKYNNLEKLSFTTIAKGNKILLYFFEGIFNFVAKIARNGIHLHR